MAGCEKTGRKKTVVVGAGPVGAMAGIYAAQRGHEVEIYELRGGKLTLLGIVFFSLLFVAILARFISPGTESIQSMVLASHFPVLNIPSSFAP
jgi:hypothetical protein